MPLRLIYGFPLPMQSLYKSKTCDDKVQIDPKSTKFGVYICTPFNDENVRNGSARPETPKVHRVVEGFNSVLVKNSLSLL